MRNNNHVHIKHLVLTGKPTSQQSVWYRMLVSQHRPSSGAGHGAYDQAGSRHKWWVGVDKRLSQILLLFGSHQITQTSAETLDNIKTFSLRNTLG